MLNAIPTDRGYIPTPEFVVQAATLDEFCRGATSIRYFDNSVETFAGDRTKLYTLDETAAVDISKAGGYDLSLSPDKFWEFATLGETMIACNISELPQQFAKGDVLFSDLTQAPKAALATVIGVQESFLMLARLDQGGTQALNKVAWNAPGDLTQWTPGVDFAGEQALEGDGGPIRQVLGGEFGVIFQDQAMWTVEFVGLPPVFAFRQVLTDHGLSGRRSAIIHNNSVYYLNRTGFYKLSREGGPPTPIGASQVDQFFWASVDPERLDEVQAFAFQQEDAIMWSFPSRLAGPGLTDRALVYSIVGEYWGFIAIESQFLFGGYTSTQNTDDVTEDIDTGLFANVSVDSPIFTETERLTMAFVEGNKLAFVNGPPKLASFSTGLLVFDEDRFEVVNKFRPLVEKHGPIQGAIAIRDELDQPSRLLPTRELSRHGYFEFRTARPFPRARYFQFNLTIADGWDNLVGINIPSKEIHVVSER